MSFGVSVVSNSCAFYFAHEAAGAQSIRHSLRPLDFEGRCKSSGESCRGNANAWLQCCRSPSFEARFASTSATVFFVKRVAIVFGP